MLHLKPLGVEVFISKSQSDQLDSYWNNYDLMLWKKTHSGFFNVKGLFRKNSWGIVEKFSMTNDGTWVLPKKYVRYLK